MTYEHMNELASRREMLDEARCVWYEAKADHEPKIERLRSKCDHTYPDGTTAHCAGFIQDTCLICDNTV